jgi:hypothetical protein
MEAWMEFEAMLTDVFQQPGAYPYPFGSTSLGQLYEMSDEALRRLPLPRLRDTAVSVDHVFAEVKGAYLATWHIAEALGLTPYLEERIVLVARTLRRIQAQQRRLRALLDQAPQPRQVGRN